MAVFSLSSRMAKRERSTLSQDSSKDTHPLHEGSTFKANHLSKATSPNTIILMNRVSKYEFFGDTNIRSITHTLLGWQSLPPCSHSFPSTTSLFNFFKTSRHVSPSLSANQPCPTLFLTHKIGGHSSPSSTPLFPGPSVVPVPPNPNLDLTNYPACGCELLEETSPRHRWHLTWMLPTSAFSWSAVPLLLSQLFSNFSVFFQPSTPG